MFPETIHIMKTLEYGSSRQQETNYCNVWLWYGVSILHKLFFNVCADTCILNHRKFMKVQPLHVPVDCITTLKNDKSYSWRDAISKWDAILLT